MENQQPVGTLSRDEIIKALSEQSENAVIHNVMNKELLFLKAQMPLEEAWHLMQQHKTLMPVFTNNKLVGTLDTENILEFIMIKNAKG